MGRVVDFDVAQALVNYIVRGSVPLDMGREDFTDSTIREKLVELKDGSNWVSVADFNRWLSEKSDPRLHADHKVEHLKQMIRRAARTI